MRQYDLREDVVDSSKDIIVYVELALTRLQNRLSVSENNAVRKHQRNKHSMVQYS